MGDKSKDRRQFIWWVLHRTAGPYFRRRFNYACEPIEVEGPYLLVSNHVTNNDPFFVGLSAPGRPLTYVASEHIFRQGLVSSIIKKLLSPIPRSKAASGAGTVKSVLRRIKEGESVALFAEGDCTWSGLSSKVFPATGKLAKACGAPLVTYRIEGGYLSHPRWAKNGRKGRMHGGPVHVYTAEELKGMTAEEVTAAIDRDIYEDAWQRQAEEGPEFKGRGKAEGLERGFYICPCCGGMKLTSEGDMMTCANCATTVRVGDTGRLSYSFNPEIPPVGRHFADNAAWDAWQAYRMDGIAKGDFAEPEHASIPCLYTKVNDDKREKGRKVLLTLSIKGHFMSIDGEELAFGDISDMSMVKTNRLLYTTAEGYYELKSGEGCLRMVLNAWQAAKRCGKEE